jgi:hypothetical protein
MLMFQKAARPNLAFHTRAAICALACVLLLAVGAVGQETDDALPHAHLSDPAAQPPTAGTPSPEVSTSQLPQMSFKWSATSPAIHLGDRYQIIVENPGESAQRLWVRTTIMDHSTHTTAPVLDEPLDLAPGEQHELVAVNQYGTANHFVTQVVSESRNLTLSVTISDAAGQETAHFNQRAFWVKEQTSFRFVLPRTRLARFLDLSPTELEAKLARGQSLTNIAARQGKDVSALQRLITKSFEAQLQQAAESGRLSSEQAETIQGRLISAVNVRIEHHRQNPANEHDHNQMSGPMQSG